MTQRWEDQRATNHIPQLQGVVTMAIISVSDFSSFINQQIQAQEQIKACLWRLKALITVTVMMNNFYELSRVILHNYFSIATDLIEEAAKANQTSLNELDNSGKLFLYNFI